ncbi:MAG: hypothetical protein ACR2KG_02835 [Nocardioidaceae bacterium]
MTTAALLALPVAAAAHAQPIAAPASTIPAAVKYNTAIKFLSFDHVRPYNSAITIRGQVLATVNGHQGSVANARVQLWRKWAGDSTFTYVKFATTSNGKYPQFRIDAITLANAQYKIVFVGNPQLNPSSAITTGSAFRLFHASIKPGKPYATISGQMSPAYAHGMVFLEMRTCTTCAWRRVRAKQTDGLSRWAFVAGAPPSGRYYWRVSTDASLKFITSYSVVFYTQRG